MLHYKLMILNNYSNNITSQVNNSEGLKLIYMIIMKINHKKLKIIKQIIKIKIRKAIVYFNFLIY